MPTDQIHPRALPILRKLALPALLLILGSAWAWQYMCSKLLGIEDASPIASLFNVHIVLAVVFALWLWHAKKFFRVSIGLAAYFMLLSGVGNIVSLGAQLAAAPHVPASLLTVIVALAPVFTLIITLLMRSEPLTPRSTSAVVLGTAATAFILFPQTDFHASLGWCFVALIAPAGFALMGVLLSARWPGELDPLQVTFGISVAGLVWSAPLALITGETVAVSFDSAMSAIALAGFTSSLIVEYFLFSVITRIGGAVYASCADFIATGMGLFLAWLLFAETPTLPLIAAAALLVSVAFILKKADSRTMLENESRSEDAPSLRPRHAVLSP